MCGLAGYLLFDQNESSNHVMREMLRLQNHRGPDDSRIVGLDLENESFEQLPFQSDATFLQKIKCVFGFNRLSILDLSSNGHQPMISADSKVVIMLNGEIYNAFDYKEILGRKGYHFKSRTDTEIALYLYQEYGISGMLERLNGMFAIAIADLSLQKIFLMRDRLGIKPLYILEKNSRLAFSSEIKSFMALPDFKLELNSNYLSELLLFRNLINRTLFKHIRNLEQGTCLEINKDGQINQFRYFDLNLEGNQPLSGKIAADVLENTLSNSVKRQLISDVKWGCQLSGGIDSSLVTWYASKFLEHDQLETISITFDEAAFTEQKFINQVANKLDLRSHQYTIKGDDFFDVIDKATFHFEQPINHPNTICIFLLSQEAKKYVTVLLSGEGADEILCGYDRFIDFRKHPLNIQLLLSKLKQNHFNCKNLLSYYSKEETRLVMSSAFGTISTSNILLPDFDFGSAIEERLKILSSINGNERTRHRKYELKTYLPDLLMRQDKMSMAHSIENRVPFLDNEMLSVSMNININDLIVKHKGKNMGKYLLKKICSDKFGYSFAYRDKMSFSIPLRSFMNSKLFIERWNDDIFPGIQRRNIFNYRHLKSLFLNRNKSTPDEIEALWLMSGFEIWAKLFLDRSA